jgi:hypothetical protein
MQHFSQSLAPNFSPFTNSGPIGSKISGVSGDCGVLMGVWSVRRALCAANPPSFFKSRAPVSHGASRIRVAESVLPRLRQKIIHLPSAASEAIVIKAGSMERRTPIVSRPHLRWIVATERLSVRALKRCGQSVRRRPDRFQACLKTVVAFLPVVLTTLAAVEYGEPPSISWVMISLVTATAFDVCVIRRSGRCDSARLKTRTPTPAPSL